MADKATGTELSRQQLLDMLRRMWEIRLFEDKVYDLLGQNIIKGASHLYAGEEAVAVGAVQALRDDDLITSTHRGHGHCLAKGARLDRMFCELLGRAPGYCGGKGGSMHIADQEMGNLGANAIVCGSAGIATGAAFSAKWRGTDQVVAMFFGEGALGQGVLYEVMNMASLWKLPIIYVCEDNLYNEYTHFTETTAGQILARPRAFDIHAVEVNGQDVRAVYQTMVGLVERTRRGEGPSFLLCHTYRYRGHHVGDINRGFYRTKEEEQMWMTERDPLKLLSGWVIDQHLADAGVFDQIEKSVRAEAEAAVQFALNAPYPDPSEVDKHVYA